jgi:hypothetical protein
LWIVSARQDRGQAEAEQRELDRPDALLRAGHRVVDAVGRVVAVRPEEPGQEAAQATVVLMLVAVPVVVAVTVLGMAVSVVVAVTFVAMATVVLVTACALDRHRTILPGGEFGHLAEPRQPDGPQRGRTAPIASTTTAKPSTFSGTSARRSGVSAAR